MSLPEVQEVIRSLCCCCRGLLFFGVVVLIGTGWSYMKPFIDDRTRQVLMIVIPLQVSGRP